MKIGIVGLGLIGASFAKAIHEQTEHETFGFDIDSNTLEKELKQRDISGILDNSALKECSLLLLAAVPSAVISYTREHAPFFPKNLIAVDCCGVKGFLQKPMQSLAKQYGFTYVGGHPMAGMAHVGCDYASGMLFSGASMILTPDAETPDETKQWLESFFLSLGFGSIKWSTPEEHDQEIAFTSQLAHILSNAYIKSPSALDHKGFSAGSFRDLTRVAWLNEKMWTELFLENREALLKELDLFISNVTSVRNALENRDAETLESLLRTGREQKERVDRL